MSIACALAALRPGARFVVRGDTIAGIEWLDQSQTQPTEQEIAAWIASPAEANAAVVAKMRALESTELLPRPVRDLVKKSVAEDAAALGYTLDQVYAIAVQLGDAAPEAAKGWKKFKDFDDRIQALKEQLQ